jgi:hypothetical protein
MVSLGFAVMITAHVFVPSSSVILRAWLSSLSALGVIWGSVLQRYGGRLPLRTDVLVMIGFSTTHLLPPLYLSIRLQSAPFLDAYNVADVYPLVALVTTIGAMALLTGYRITEGPSRIAARMNQTGKIMPGAQTLLIVIAVVVWVARSVLIAKGAYYWVYSNEAFLFGRWYSATSQITRYGLILPILLWLMAYKKPHWRRWAWVATAGEIAWVVPSGATQRILETLFGLLLVAWWCNKRLPRKWVAALLVVAVVGMPIIREYRYTIGLFTDMNRVSVGATTTAARLARERFEWGQGGTILNYADSSAQRIYDAQFLGYLLKHYREVYDWEYGKTYYIRVPFLLLPYFIFPDRPIMQVPIDHWFKLVAGGSAPSTFLGEAYINFGYAGILIIPFLFGIILGAYDALFRKRQNDILTVAVYLLIGSGIPFMVTQSLTSWLAYLRNAVLMVLAIYMGLGFMAFSKRRLKTS